MARRSGTEKVSRYITTVTAASPATSDVVPATAGYVIAPKEIIATNTGDTPIGLYLYEESTLLHPVVVIASSGSYTWSVASIGGVELATGSGIKASLSESGTVDLVTYYVSYDESGGITKSDARAATFVASNATAIRAPNEFGQQAKS